MIDQKAVEYIKNSVAQGKSKEELYKEFLAQGWSLENIQDNFNALEEVGDKEDTQKRTIKIIVTVGAVLIGAGIFSFIAANWEHMAKPLRIILIIISMLAAYFGGWTLKEKYSFGRSGDALLLLGSIIYGAGIFLIAQMFHTRANWPDGFILWMIGVIVLAFAIESFPHFYLAIILGFIAIVGHPIEIFTGIFGYRSFLLTSTVLLFIVTTICFVSGWLMQKRLPPELKDFY